MKRSGLKRVISAGLMLTMVLSGLTGCGKGGTKSADSGQAKQGVYREQEIEIPELGQDYSIRDLIQTEDKIYVFCDVYNWEDEGNENQYKMLSMKPDGTDIRIINMQLSLGGEAADGTEESKAEEQGAAAEGAVTEPATEEGDAVIDDMMLDYDSSYYYEYTNLSNCIVTDDEIIYGVKSYYMEENDEQGNYTSVNEYYVCSWNMDGVMQWETAIEGLQTEESYSYIEALLEGTGGNLVVLTGGDKTEKLFIKAEGSLNGAQSISDNLAESFSSASSFFAGENGKINMIYWNEPDYDKMYIAEYDIEKDTLGEAVQLPDTLVMNNFGLHSGNSDDVIYANSDGIYSYNVGDTEAKQLMSFVNSDLMINSVYAIAVTDDEHILMFYYDDSVSGIRSGIFTKVDPADIKDKDVLVLAGNYITYDLRERVIEYNKSSEDYRIVLKDYSTYNTMEDYSVGNTQLNNDIISGNMPDILLVDSDMPMESYISKGLLADVDKLIEADEELSEAEFMENVFDAYRVDGRLYYVISSFGVRTMIGKTSLVGERNTWTMQDLNSLKETLPEEIMIFGDKTRADFLYTMMYFCGNDFVDVSTGKCNFDSQNFIDMLEYAATLPEQMDDDFYNEDYWMNYESQYREDRTLLMDCYISNARDMNRNQNGYFGEDISYIGFPTESGKGSVIRVNDMLALSAKSANLDAAWEFVRYYLTEEYQREEVEWNLPVLKSVFMEKVQEATRNPYYMEGDEKIEYEDTFWINDESIVLPNMTEEQADEFTAFVESVDKTAYYNENVQNIITEEAAAFFAGQKTAQDVAKIIQSRVQVYVNENS